MYCAIQKRLGRFAPCALKSGHDARRKRNSEVSEEETADQQILAILEALQKAAENGGSLEDGEVERVRAILQHGETLVKIAKYEEAKGLFWAHWRGIILAAGAVIAALMTITTKGEKLLSKVVGLFS